MNKLLMVILAIFSINTYAGVDTDTNENGVILAGHDTVAYHTQGEAVLGNAEITAVYNDAIYRFSSEDNRDLFVSNPDKFAPAYGGFCAYGVGVGKKFAVDGKAFEVVDGQLYVNKNLKVYEIWRQDIPGNIESSEAKWPNISDVAADQL